MADEMIGMLKVMMKGVVVDDDTLALDAIRDVGPGGVYLGHHHTYAHFREFWQPSLMANISYEGWEAGGSMSIQDRVKERLQEIIATHKPRPIPAEAQTKIDEIIARARARAAA